MSPGRRDIRPRRLEIDPCWRRWPTREEGPWPPSRGEPHRTPCRGEIDHGGFARTQGRGRGNGVEAVPALEPGCPSAGRDRPGPCRDRCSLPDHNCAVGEVLQPTRLPVPVADSCSSSLAGKDRYDRVSSGARTGVAAPPDRSPTWIRRPHSPCPARAVPPARVHPRAGWRARSAPQRCRSSEADLLRNAPGTTSLLEIKMRSQSSPNRSRPLALSSQGCKSPGRRPEHRAALSGENPASSPRRLVGAPR